MAIGKDEFPMKLRYGMRHTWRCECSDCLSAFRTHSSKYGNCNCEDCANTRLWAAQKRDKAARDNLAPKVARKEYKTVATINLCDRCESMAKSPAMGLVVIVPATDGPEMVYADSVQTTDRDTVRMDLCPACVAELMEWKDADPGFREKAYSKPWKKDDRPKGQPSSSELFALAIEASKREMESGEVPE